MEIVYFVLGVVTVLLVLGIVVIVRLGTLVKELKENVQTLERIVCTTEESVHRRIDDEMRNIQSEIDSKMDKMMNKINKQKDLLKG